jgi:hypothetical protein
MSQWQSPGDQPPGAPPSSPYGGGYGSYEPGAPPPRTDGISIAAFVCALTCCAGPVGVGLGIAGIVRTKDGQRRGRWAAVTGVVLGAIGTLALIAGIVGMTVIGFNIVFEEDARVGQCVNTGFLGTDTDDLWDADCSEDHDAEIVAVLVADAELEADYDDNVSIATICGPFVDDAYKSLLTDDQYEMDFSTDSYDDSINDGDWLVCYLERADGEQLDGPLTGGASTGA